MTQNAAIQRTSVGNTDQIPFPYQQGSSTYGDIERPPAERVALLKAIDVLTTLEDDWDGNNTLAPEPQALSTTHLLVRKIAWNKRFPRSVSPGTDGSVVLKWAPCAEGSILMMTIDPHYVGVALIEADGNVIDKGDFSLLPDDVVLPTELQNVIPAK